MIPKLEQPGTVYSRLADGARLEADQPWPVPKVQDGTGFSEQAASREAGPTKAVPSSAPVN